MVTVRWRIPIDRLTDEGVTALLACNDTTHRIYATGAEALLRAWREDEAIVVEGAADAPADNVKSFTRYMVISWLGGKEETS
ncbi:MAG: hypothetical protein KatS3mg060_2727 [Dehalococcoidia bacterium]|nr:MAG: hypothetical protein KatS3mg060_2727 [Dehalococcoidia bacterium]